jgi:SMP-30/Gluconolactonase/LRE-like region
MLITQDGETLIVAESYAKRLAAFDVDTDGSLSNRRVWADLGDGVPDGICGSKIRSELGIVLRNPIGAAIARRRVSCAPRDAGATRREVGA